MSFLLVNDQRYSKETGCVFFELKSKTGIILVVLLQKIKINKICCVLTELVVPVCNLVLFIHIMTAN